MNEPTLEWFKDFEIRVGPDGSPSVYVRGGAVRLARFSKGVDALALQTRLRLLFNRAHKPKAKPRKRRAPSNEAWGEGSGNW